MKFIAMMFAFMLSAVSFTANAASAAFYDPEIGIDSVGYAWNSETLDNAIANSLHQCRKSGTNCVPIIMNAGKGWMAIVSDGKYVAIASGYVERAAAINTALEDCFNKTNNRCFVKVLEFDQFADEAALVKQREAKAARQKQQAQQAAPNKPTPGKYDVNSKNAI